MRTRPTADGWHRKRHRDPTSSPNGCWQCRREHAACRSKIAFATVAEADEWVADFNRAHGYSKAVVRYPCVWCPGWHMATARKPHQLRRVEKARRKDLVGCTRTRWPEDHHG